MDEKKLAKILAEDNAPDIDVNARKRAVNSAVAEFKMQKQKKNQETFQGVSFLARLTGIGNKKRGYETMEQKSKRKFVYGATATAMAVVFVGGLSLTQIGDVVEEYKTVDSDVSRVLGGDVKNVPAYTSTVGEKASPPKQSSGRDEADANGTVVDRSDLRLKPADPQGKFSGEEVKGSVEGRKKALLERSQGKLEQKNEAGLAGSASKADAAREGVSKIQAVEPMDKWTRETSKDAEIEFGEVEEEVTDVAVETPSSVDVGAGYSSRKMAPKEEAQVPKKRQLAKTKEKLGEDKQVYGGTLSIAEPESVVSDDLVAPTIYQDVGRDQFEDFKPNPFKMVSEEPVSTFSSDVDTASYSFIRRQLNSGVLPQKDAVRVEEMINYFSYNYPVPESREEPFKPFVTITDSPWAEGKKLMHIGIKGYQLEKTELRSNLVFLLDVSGSMNSPDKLPLVKNSMKMLLDSLHPDDTVSIVIYAGSTGVVLEPTKVSKRTKILNAMQNLRAGGSTAGAAGIQLAYNMAEQNFDENSVNRVILATDGDFNVGITNREELQDFVERKRDKGIFLSVLGFGQGNYNDHMMQTLAQNGNGIAAYIDNLNEARKVLVQEATSSLFPIAKDVKFQVEFNPETVAEYRLIGYETRRLKREDFNNDKIDAGDMGAGHTVTAMYEFVPVGSEAVSVDPLRYSKIEKKAVLREKDDLVNAEYAFLKIRYKLPLESKSKLITRPVTAHDAVGLCPPMARCSVGPSRVDTLFASSVAAFGQILKGGEHIGDYSYDDVIALAQQGKGADHFGYRAEFINMVRLAKTHSR